MLKSSNPQSISPVRCSGTLPAPAQETSQLAESPCFKGRIPVPPPLCASLLKSLTTYTPILDVQNRNGSKLQCKTEAYSKALSQCQWQQAKNSPSTSLAQTHKPVRVTSKGPLTSLLFSSRFPSFPWNLVLFPTVMVKLFFASQGSTGCLSLELLTARLDKAHENMPRGTMLHMISQHS